MSRQTISTPAPGAPELVSQWTERWASTRILSFTPPTSLPAAFASRSPSRSFSFTYQRIDQDEEHPTEMVTLQWEQNLVLRLLRTAVDAVNQERADDGLLSEQQVEPGSPRETLCEISDIYSTQEEARLGFEAELEDVRNRWSSVR